MIVAEADGGSGQWGMGGQGGEWGGRGGSVVVVLGLYIEAWEEGRGKAGQNFQKEYESFWKLLYHTVGPATQPTAKPRSRRCSVS